MSRVVLPGITPPHIARMIEEKNALDGNIHRLSAFFATDTFERMEQTAAALMASQMCVMQAYSAILGARIDYTAPKPPLTVVGN